jgi:hypothetical protein
LLRVSDLFQKLGCRLKLSGVIKRIDDRRFEPFNYVAPFDPLHLRGQQFFGDGATSAKCPDGRRAVAVKPDEFEAGMS